MFFVVDRVRMCRMINLTRDDRSKPKQDTDVPFFRIEAQGEQLRLTGRNVEAVIPATVYEAGVLFLRVTLFRRLLATMAENPTIAIQVTSEGLHFGDTKSLWDVGDMLLYVDPAQAPPVHPAESQSQPPSMKGTANPPPEKSSAKAPCSPTWIHSANLNVGG